VIKRNEIPRALEMILAAGVMFLMLSGLGCAGAPKNSPLETRAAPRLVLTISGSGSTTSILEALQPAFEKDHPDYRLEVLAGTGTNEGITGVQKGVLDIVAMARPLKESETALNIKYAALGRAGVAIITHSNVGVKDLTTEQAVAIFSGAVTNWARVGGPNKDIILFIRDAGDSSTDALGKTILKGIPFSEKAARVLTSQNAMQSAVEGTPDSVGFGTWAGALANRGKVQAISLDKIPPGDPRYPVSVLLGIGYLANRQSDVQPLLDWLVSPRGKQALMSLSVIVSE
jgi:phosphate transport system substrate-binding protein